MSTVYYIQIAGLVIIVALQQLQIWTLIKTNRLICKMFDHLIAATNANTKGINHLAQGELTLVDILRQSRELNITTLKREKQHDEN